MYTWQDNQSVSFNFISFDYSWQFHVILFKSLSLCQLFCNLQSDMETKESNSNNRANKVTISELEQLKLVCLFKQNCWWQLSELSFAAQDF